MPDRDELYEKYRVFREPEEPTAEGHPVTATASYFVGYTDNSGEVWASMYEVEGFTFVLKPDSDPYAREALRAYAEACRVTHPQLSDDLFGVLDLTPTLFPLEDL